MRLSLVVFVAANVLGSWGLAFLAYSLQDQLGQLAGLLMLPALVLPLAMAYICHFVIDKHAGNPFRGLRFGTGGWIFLAWLGGLAAGYFAVLIAVGLNLHGLDFSMSSYVESVREMARAQGNEIPDEAAGFLGIQGYITMAGAPLVGAWIAAAATVLVTFPWYGWFMRRLMLNGRMNALTIMLYISLVSSASGGLMANPQFGDTPMFSRMMLMALMHTAFIPAAWWIFLKSRSAVIPALAQGSYSMALAGAVPALTEGPVLWGIPAGVVPALVALFVGVALWTWQDPGGRELEVADVAFDGTPLTREDLAQQSEQEEKWASAVGAAGAMPDTGSIPAPDTESEADSTTDSEDKAD
jgi:hypothetical protein